MRCRGKSRIMLNVGPWIAGRGDALKRILTGIAEHARLSATPASWPDARRDALEPITHQTVIFGLAGAIHAFPGHDRQRRRWPGTSPAMTRLNAHPPPPSSSGLPRGSTPFLGTTAKDVDGPDKPGHDALECASHPPSSSGLPEDPRLSWARPSKTWMARDKPGHDALECASPSTVILGLARGSTPFLGTTAKDVDGPGQARP